jgi:2,2-dialkylglycine decarboxylase (pyruvate)
MKLFERKPATASSKLLFYGRDFADVIITRASGTYIYDEDGRAILDFSSGQMCATLGHNHPAIVAALEKAAREVIHLDSTKLSPAVIALAEELTSLLPPTLQRAMFLNTGGEANEAALKLAKLHTGRWETVALEGSWHGMTAGAYSNTYATRRHGYGPPMPGSYLIPAPNAYRCPIRHCRDVCDKTCLEVGFDLYDKWSSGAGAALIAEPIQSAGGIIVPPEGYFLRMAELCRERGLMLVLDEAQTAVRTGSNFAFEDGGAAPDILVLSKTLGAGVPLAAVITSDEVAEDTRRKRFSFYTSHVSDPMTCEVGLAVMRTVIAESLTQRALAALKDKYEVIGDVRGRGLLIGVEVVTDREKRTPAMDLIARVSKRALELGLNMNRVGGEVAVWRIAPPLTATTAELDRGVAILDQALHDCGAH